MLSLPADDTPSFADEHLAAVKRAVGAARNAARTKEAVMRDAGRGGAAPTGHPPSPLRNSHTPAPTTPQLRMSRIARLNLLPQLMPTSSRRTHRISW